jgi:hypothetical protein
MRVIIQQCEIEKHFEKDVIEDNNFSEILINYIQENYFNGADNACIYLGYNHRLEYYEIDILPG